MSQVKCHCGLTLISHTIPERKDDSHTNFYIFCGGCPATIFHGNKAYTCSSNICCYYCAKCVFKENNKMTNISDGYRSWHNTRFAEGSIRNAHLGVVMKGKKRGKKVVIKVFKNRKIYTKAQMDPELKVYKKGKELVDEWNKLELINKKYVLEEPELSTVRRGSSNFKTNEWIFIETYLEGEWEKWNNNGGFVHKKSASIQAFCHWTYHYTDGDVLFCDAQGVRAEYKYYITDPALHSKWQEYGDTDLGTDGFEYFFNTHICNEFCDKNWKKFKGKSKSTKRAKGKATVYKWQTGRMGF